ncbi:hypothetical protein BST41_28335 [Mycolicibacterium porcinum]|nr:hypothetical protein BST41_28335 [Mycolicibacterium porcinum]
MLLVFGVLWLFVDLLLFSLLGLLLRRLLLWLLCRFLCGLLLGCQVVVGWLLAVDRLWPGLLVGILRFAALFTRRHLAGGVVDVDAVALRRGGVATAGVATVDAGHAGWLELASPTRTEVRTRTRAGPRAGGPRLSPRQRRTETAFTADPRRRR